MTEEITPAMRAAGAAAAFEGPWPDNVDAIYRAMRNAAPRRAIMLETAAADDEAQDREKDWRAVCAGTATLDQFVAAVSYAAACAGWDGSPSGAALARPHSAVAPAGDGVVVVPRETWDAIRREAGSGGNTAPTAIKRIGKMMDALARPRAAVGEQSREAIARAAADGCDDEYPEGRRVQNGGKWWAAYDGAMRALALQSSLAKEN